MFGWWLRQVVLAVSVGLLTTAFAIRYDEGASLAAAESGNSDLPLSPTRTVRFTTNEGSWLSVDVSPDGQMIVCDLLGDLYLLPISGGRATRITSGPAVDLQPRFSPDGKHIVFLSDRSGAYNVWVIDADGGNPKPVTHSESRNQGGARDYIQPQWTPDGRAIVVAETVRSPLGYDLAAIDLLGNPVTQIRVANQSPSVNPSPGIPQTFYTAAATFGASGRGLYATQYTGMKTSSPRPEGSIFQVVQIDPATGRRSTLTSEVGSAVQPLASPDGRYLVFGSKYPSPDGPKTGMKLLALRTGVTNWLVPQIEPSLQGSFVHWDWGLLPNAAFTPDSKSLVASYGGRLWRVAVPSGASQEIKFVAEVEQQLGPLLRFPLKYNDAELTVRIVRDVRRSPDGRRLALVALDRVWVMDVPNGTPRRLTAQENEIECSPAWSPDGKYLAYVTWTERGGHVDRVPIDEVVKGPARPERLTREPDFYDKLVYSPDGRSLVMVRAKWQNMLERGGVKAQTIKLVVMPAEGGEQVPVFEINTRGVDYSYGWPHFSQRDSTRIFFYAEGSLWSVKQNGSGHDALIKTTGLVRDILLSPDGNRALLPEVFNSVVSMVEVPKADGTLSVSPWSEEDQTSQRLLTPQGGEFPWWSADGKSFSYSLGHSFFACDLNRAIGGTSPATSYRPDRLDITIKVLKDKPSGTILLSGGRIITMHDHAVVENGDILVRNNRIVAVGAQGTLTVPAGTRRFDVTGKTVLPGYVLTHEHIEAPYNVHAQLVWQYLLGLSYGVTTVNDPQAGSSADRFTYADRLEVGSLLGPRHISTGAAVMAQPINTEEEARDLVRRYSRFYDSHMLKERGSGNRRIRQWVAVSASEEKLTAVGHWNQDLISQVLDGYSGIEHATFVPWYDDMVQLVVRSQTIYTPTTMVASNGPEPIGYFTQQTDLTKEDRLWRFAPAEWLDHLMLPQLSSSGLAFQQGYAFTLEAAQAAKLMKTGGRVGVGTDSTYNTGVLGLGAHWEMQALVLGGMSPRDVLWSATLTGAEAVGMDHDLGSIEPGKLADLQVLDLNPLENIRNTNSVHWVMKNGRLYDAATLDEVWPRNKPFAPSENDRPWWWEELPPWMRPEVRSERHD